MSAVSSTPRLSFLLIVRLRVGPLLLASPLLSSLVLAIVDGDGSGHVCIKCQSVPFLLDQLVLDVVLESIIETPL